MAATLFRVLVAALALAGGTALAQARFGPVAVVNDRVITGYDVDQRARLMQLTGEGAGRSAALEALIEERLKLHGASRLGLSSNEQSRRQAVERFGQQRQMGMEQLQAGLGRAGVALTALEDTLVAREIWAEAVRAKFGARVRITELQIDEYLAKADGAGGDFVEVIVAQGRGEGARAALQRLRAESPRCESAPDVATRLGLTTSPRSQPTPLSQVNPVLRQAVEPLKPGDISAPVRGPGGVWAGFALCARSGPDGPAAREAARRALLDEALADEADVWLEELRAQAVIERR